MQPIEIPVPVFPKDNSVWNRWISGRGITGATGLSMVPMVTWKMLEIMVEGRMVTATDVSGKSGGWQLNQTPQYV